MKHLKYSYNHFKLEVLQQATKKQTCRKHLKYSYNDSDSRKFITRSRKEILHDRSEFSNITEGFFQLFNCAFIPLKTRVRNI
jgi:hypothetical protein